MVRRVLRPGSGEKRAQLLGIYSVTCLAVGKDFFENIEGFVNITIVVISLAALLLPNVIRCRTNVEDKLFH